MGRRISEQNLTFLRNLVGILRAVDLVRFDEMPPGIASMLFNGAVN
ncbi:hypothetical protein [Rhodopseudomonas palustris]|nr:hypothetical protein [Rhodopseudomonas palustris]